MNQCSHVSETQIQFAVGCKDLVGALSSGGVGERCEGEVGKQVSVLIFVEEEQFAEDG
jgi:hypothetical protein